MKSAQTELAVAPKGDLARAPMPVINIESLIEKAVDSKAAVEVVKELRAMFLDDQKRAAEAAFNESMSAFQSECPIIIKGKQVMSNDKKLYAYAPIEKIEEVIRPICRTHGFSHTFDTDIASAPGWVIAKCIVTHQQGHQRITIAKFPLGAKTQIMSDTQVYAGALTFANRRVLANAYGLVITGEDKDGASPAKASQSGRVATLATLQWFIEQSKPWHKKLLAYGIDNGLIEPNQSLDDWPLKFTPTSKPELADFKAKVEAHV